MFDNESRHPLALGGTPLRRDIALAEGVQQRDIRCDRRCQDRSEHGPVRDDQRRRRRAEEHNLEQEAPGTPEVKRCLRGSEHPPDDGREKRRRDGKRNVREGAVTSRGTPVA